MTAAISPAPRALLAEALGTALLLAIVVGSGIMGERLAGGNVAIALLANAAATAGGLYVLIVLFGPLSGAHFNPAVTLARALTRSFAGIRPEDVGAFVVAQCVGAGIALLLARSLVPAGADSTRA